MFANLLKIGMPTPVIPDIDGLHHDWTLLGKKIQAKVARKMEKQSAWVVMHMEHLGRNNQQAVSFGAYDALWIHCGADKFILILLPASILRRHSVFLGQGSCGKGRRALCMYPDTSPTRGNTAKWKKLCQEFVCSWNEADLKAKVEKILANC